VKRCEAQGRPAQAGLTASSLRAPRAAAIAGIAISVLLIASFVLLFLAMPFFSAAAARGHHHRLLGGRARG
jgi:hypothetical protein